MSNTRCGPLTAFRLYGIEVWTDLSLAGRACVPSRIPDVVVVRHDTGEPWTPQSGWDVLAEQRVGERSMYTAWRLDDGTVRLRVHGLCDFEIDRSFEHVTWEATLDCRPEFVPILVSGTVLSLLLTLRGVCVLHASAVALRRGSVGIVGPSGTGKSTVATQLCAAGGSLVTDDVMACVIDGNRIRIEGGVSELRLRPKAASLLTQFDEPLVSRATADGRAAIEPPRLHDAPSHLQAIVLPRPTHDSTDIVFERLDRLAALFELVSNPRIALCDTELLAQHFQAASGIIDRVPVIRATIPWGPPFDPRTASLLLNAIPG
jgi:hypothetical protein